MTNKNLHKNTKNKSLQADFDNFIREELKNYNPSKDKTNLNTILELRPHKFIALDSLREVFNGLGYEMGKMDSDIEEFQNELYEIEKYGKNDPEEVLNTDFHRR